MKPALLVAGIALLGVGGYVALQSGAVTYEKEVKTETIVEVQTINELEARITSAVEAKSADIEALAQKAYEEAKANELLEIERSVTSEYRKELQAREAELNEKSTSY
jgi:hypothetical protein